MRRSRRLNPCDCGFHAFDYHMKRRGYPGATALLAMDIVGRLESADVVSALRRAMELHPTTAGAAAVSFWRRWPIWRHTRGPVQPDYLYEDLSGEADWVAAAEKLPQERLSLWWDTSQPPLVRLDHYRGPHGQHRLCLRWPHALMDAGGGQYFLAEMSRLGDSKPSQLPDHLLPDTELVDPLADFGPLGRARLLAQWVRQRDPRVRVPNASLYDRLPERTSESRRLRCLHRAWSAEMVERLRRNARRIAPSGPGLHSRFLAGCVLRAVHQMHREHGCALPVYHLVFPMGFPGLARRPIVGNYLMSPSFRVTADRIADKRALAEDIDRQLCKYLEQRSYLAEWALHRLTAQLRASQYRRLVEYHLRDQPVATGFAFIGEVDPPIRRFLGAEVTNLWAAGVFNIPPGWNPTFFRFRDRLNLGLAWPEGAFPAAVVQRYADLMEQEAFES
jgi:hypothetical protein